MRKALTVTVDAWGNVIVAGPMHDAACSPLFIAKIDPHGRVCWRRILEREAPPWGFTSEGTVEAAPNVEPVNVFRKQAMRADDDVDRSFAGFGPWDIAVDDTHVYWTNWGPCLQSMGCAARPPSDELHGRVSRIPKAGGEREILAEGFLLPTGIALDDVAVYWTTWWFSSVMKRAK